ncbi:MAG TPA: MFS transporter [Pseudonocardiaceae bacterium]|jgi:EmrB/QacA subfamily drug resistance transporter|nr:MFS transporter [Pseudonocardiaceae bacterium]
MSLLIVGLDNTIVNVALPAIQHELAASPSSLQWVIDAYTLVLASLLMLSGSTADRVGRRRTFQTGLVLFTLGSLLCSLAPSIGWLIGFRAVQAIGGSMLNPVAMSIIRNVFTDPKERARAIGVWSGVIGLSMALGPVVGGLLVGTVGWRSIFWINIPVGVAAVILTAVFVPESRAPRARRIDPVGQLLVIITLAALSYGIIEGPGHGWVSKQIIGCFVLAALALVALLIYEPRRTDPLLELSFFRSIPFSGATLLAVCMFAALGGFLFVNTLYLQDARGFSALKAGLYTVPMAALVMIVAPLSGRIVAARGSRLPVIVAGVLLAISAAILTTITVTTPATVLLCAYVVFGFGFGAINAPITNTAVSGMPAAQAGVAAAVASTSRQVGQSMGVAVIGSAVTGGLHGEFGPQFAVASHVGWWIIVGCGLAVILVGVVTTGKWARGTAERAAARTASVPELAGKVAS